MFRFHFMHASWTELGNDFNLSAFATFDSLTFLTEVEKGERMPCVMIDDCGGEDREFEIGGILNDEGHFF